VNTPLSQERALFNIFAPSVAYVAVENKSGEQGIGTCFHIGENVFITARHVVENHKITKIATTVGSIDYSFGSFWPRETSQIKGPFFIQTQITILQHLSFLNLMPHRLRFFPFLKINLTMSFCCVPSLLWVIREYPEASRRFCFAPRLK
jgi:hypothetical protein